MTCVAPLLGQTEGARLHAELFGRLPPGRRGADIARVDLAGVERVDSYGGAWMRRIAREACDRGSEIVFEGATGQAAVMLELLEPGFGCESPAAPRRVGWFEAVGDAFLRGVAEARDAWRLMCECAYWCLLGPFQKRGFRWSAFWDEMYDIGVRSVALTLLINALMGFIITVLSAAQAKQFGAEIFIATALAIGFSRELGCVMTAVVVSARSGAYIAAELATMGVQEEIDALRSMGKNPVQYLVAPKILAVMVAMPILALLGMVGGMLGGTLFATLRLGIPLNAWMDQIASSLALFDIGLGVTKSFFFGAIIVFIGCHNGLRVTGGARGVGVATTRSVVQDVVLIVLVDMLFALLLTMVE